MRHYYLTYLNHKSQGKLLKYKPFWRTSYFKMMWVESFAVAVHNLPNVNYIIYYKNEERQMRYSINLFILIFMHY